jgi:hypothetical protein
VKRVKGGGQSRKSRKRRRCCLSPSLPTHHSHPLSMLIGSPLLALLALASSAVAIPTSSSSSTASTSSTPSSSSAPVVDLGKYGKYKGVVQNNGTVHSWKGAFFLSPSCFLLTDRHLPSTPSPPSQSHLPSPAPQPSPTPPLPSETCASRVSLPFFPLFPTDLTCSTTGPRTLATQNSTVQDVSADFDGHPTACVQFGTTSFVGVNAGPGQEDCLKVRFLFFLRDHALY